MEGWGQLIRECRKNFGKPPRSLDAEEREKFRLRVSCLLRVIFLLSGDKLRKILRDQRILRDHGRVVWGYLVQANEVMFDPTNTQTVPGNAIYCTDPDADDQVVLFQGVASGLFGLKGTTPRDIDLTRFSEAITNETARTMRLPLPRSLCRGKMAFFTTCLFQPSHLPGGYLASGVFPLVICPERTEAVMVLPARYWPEELCQIFASGA